MDFIGTCTRRTQVFIQPVGVGQWEWEPKSKNKRAEFRGHFGVYVATLKCPVSLYLLSILYILSNILTRETQDAGKPSHIVHIYLYIFFGENA